MLQIDWYRTMLTNIFFGLLSFYTVSQSACFAEAKAAGETVVEEIIPEFEVHETTARPIFVNNERFSPKKNVPEAIYWVNYVTDTKTTPEDVALQYLQNLFSDHGAEFDVAELAYKSTWESPAGFTVRFDQTYNGLPVYKSDLAVTLDHDLMVLFAMNGYNPIVGLPLGESEAISMDAAMSTALSYLGVSPQDAINTDIVQSVYPGETPRLVWQITVQSIIGLWEILVDSNTGEIIKAVDSAHHAQGTGTVFNPNPLTFSGATYDDPGYTDNSDADSPELAAEVVTVTLEDITFSGGLYLLVGPYAQISEEDSPNKGTFAQASEDFLFTREEDGFEAVNCYYHLHTFMKYMNEDLGLTIMPSMHYSGGVKFDPHARDGSTLCFLFSSRTHNL